MKHLMGILIYFKTFFVCLIDNNLSEMEFISLYKETASKLSKHISFCEIIYFLILIFFLQTWQNL